MKNIIEKLEAIITELNENYSDMIDREEFKWLKDMNKISNDIYDVTLESAILNIKSAIVNIKSIIE